MLRRMLLGSFVAASLVVPAAASPAAATAAARDDTRALLQALLEAEHDAGMPGVFAEVRDGRRAWELAAGVADVDTGRPVRPYFRHRVGSITKTFVATTVLQLVGERRLRLDAPIGRYLPDEVPGAVGQEVTVRMLLNHTSGIGNYTGAILATPDDVVRVGQTTYTPQQLIAIGLAMPATNAPGAAWSYSNTNYVILGRLIERLTGGPYSTEISRRILRPLGLRHSYFPGADPRIRGPHSAAYVPWIDGALRDFSVYNMSSAYSAGELISTPQDLNRFYRALLTGRLLRPDLLAQMQTTVPFDPAAPDAGGYGLGLYWVPTPCGRFWGHDGGTVGHVTISWHSADGRRQISLAENMAFYENPAIDEARGQFLLTATCGPQQNTTRAAPAAAPGPLTPDVTLRR